jgi:hypothetical protein
LGWGFFHKRSLAGIRAGVNSKPDGTGLHNRMPRL